MIMVMTPHMDLFGYEKLLGYTIYRQFSIKILD